jgi:flagellar basal-body rod protein FlgB
MFDNIFGIHERALLLGGQRISVIASNIANADTPGFKARDVDFTEVLANADTQSFLQAKTSSAGQVPLDAGFTSGDLKYRNPFQASLDGNTVEMPVEQAAFSAANVRYQASLMFINSRIAEMNFVLSGQ